MASLTRITKRAILGRKDEMQAKRGIMMHMNNWVQMLDAFLKFNEHELLTDADKISYAIAESLTLKNMIFEQRKIGCIKVKKFLNKSGK